MAGGRTSGADARRQESRWRGAIEVLGPTWTLEPRGTDALAALLPFAIAPAPERTVVLARGELAGARTLIAECASTLHMPGGTTSIESLVVVLDHPGAIGTVAIEFDPLTAFGGAKSRDPEIGHAAFDRCYRVHAPSEAVARASIPRAFAHQLHARRFRGILEIREGRLIASLAETRLSPPTARTVARLARSIVPALVRGAGGPYRGSPGPLR